MIFDQTPRAVWYVREQRTLRGSSGTPAAIYIVGNDGSVRFSAVAARYGGVYPSSALEPLVFQRKGGLKADVDTDAEFLSVLRRRAVRFFGGLGFSVFKSEIVPGPSVHGSVVRQLTEDIPVVDATSPDLTYRAVSLVSEELADGGTWCALVPGAARHEVATAGALIATFAAADQRRPDPDRSHGAIASIEQTFVCLSGGKSLLKGRRYQLSRLSSDAVDPMKYAQYVSTLQRSNYAFDGAGGLVAVDQNSEWFVLKHTELDAEEK